MRQGGVFEAASCVAPVFLNHIEVQYASDSVCLLLSTSTTYVPRPTRGSRRARQAAKVQTRDVDVNAAAQPARVRRCVVAIACGAKRAREDATEHAESRSRVVRARHVAEAGSMPTPHPEDGGGILSGGGA